MPLARASSHIENAFANLKPERKICSKMIVELEVVLLMAIANCEVLHNFVNRYRVSFSLEDVLHYIIFGKDS